MCPKRDIELEIYWKTKGGNEPEEFGGFGEGA